MNTEQQITEITQLMIKACVAMMKALPVSADQAIDTVVGADPKLKRFWDAINDEGKRTFKSNVIEIATT